MWMMALGVSCGCGIVLSALTARDHWTMKNYCCHYAAMVVGILLLGWATREAVKEQLLPHPLATCIAVALPTGLCYGLYIAGLWAFFLGKAGQMVMGDDALRVRPTYDQAEAAEKARDFETAAALYREAIKADDSDPTPRRRLAEILLRQGQAEAAIQALRGAANCCVDVEAKAITIFRLVEVLLSQRKDKAAAIEELRKLASAHPGTPYAENAQSRIEALS